MPRGGRRPGAGRPRKGSESVRSDPAQAEQQLAPVGTTDSKEFLEQVLAGLIAPTPLQMDAARSLLPFQHRKLGEAGKKEQRNENAAKVAGRFAPAPPRLAALGGKTV
jgi:phage terminase small subunit